MFSRLSALSLCVLLFACSDTGPDSGADTDTGEDAEEITAVDRRYCEILLGYLSGTVLEAEVWGTQLVSECVLKDWYALDADSIQAEYEALFIKMNGPRQGITDFSDFQSTTGESRMYGNVEMKIQSTLILDPSIENGPYVVSTVEQVSTKGHRAGSEVYQLVSPTGEIYTMISIYEGGDPPLTVEDLPSLGERLNPPEGWSWQAVVLDEDLSIVADGTLYTVQDELENTYQRGG